MTFKLHQAQQRKFKDPDDCKIKVAIDMTEEQRDMFKQACKLAGLRQGDFVAQAAEKYIASNV